MDPQQQPYNPNPLQPQQPPQPNIYGPVLPSPAPGVPPQPQFQPPMPPKSNKKVFIIGGAVAGIVVLLIIVAVVALSGGNKNQPPAEEHQETTEAEGPQPATAVDVEHANNSISQDISGLNDDRDFPVDQLEEKTLKL